MQLLKETYDLTARYPRQEVYGVTAQMRRAAFSIPSNIAEGHSRTTRNDFVRFLVIASGSLRELQTGFEASVLLGFANEAETRRGLALADETGRMLLAMRSALLKKPKCIGGAADR